MPQGKLRFDIPTQVGDRFIHLADVITAVRPAGLLWEMSDAWVVTKEGTPAEVREILDLAERGTVRVSWETITRCANWAVQCNDLTLRGYADTAQRRIALEIVAFESQAWEVTVHDFCCFVDSELIPLGGRWGWVDELGQTLDTNRPGGEC